MLCMEWNGDIIQVMAEDEDLAYAVPTEGSLLWQDTMAIPKGAPHPENAHAFLNFVLDARGRQDHCRDHPVCHRQCARPRS